MSSELVAIIEQIEREKGIKKDVLFAAVESALLTAARKVIDVKPGEDLRVEVDRETGKVHAWRNEDEITTIDFGRIAASTARQVIIQKIREAEKDVVFGEFQGKVGEIVAGTVYRFERGNIIIDLLGKAEGILPKREQCPGEDFRQGQRIRAYILEVKKDIKGPQIILSRAHALFVKKLFELEVPEIYEGIVEIKAIARQAGERTKIAVFSKNEKVDAVGACVGMRGNRVRNIVNELSGEKIDIVRFNDDLREYIRAALSPAKINEIRVDKDAAKAEVIVDDDQLSLAIGKHGQNVRLASKLLSWELDIRTKDTAGGVSATKPGSAAEALLGAKDAPAQESVAEDQTAAQESSVSLEELPGVGEKTMAHLKAAGFRSINDIVNADVNALLEVEGIGEKKAHKLIAEAKKLLHG